MKWIMWAFGYSRVCRPKCEIFEERYYVDEEINPFYLKECLRCGAIHREAAPHGQPAT